MKDLSGRLRKVEDILRAAQWQPTTQERQAYFLDIWKALLAGNELPEPPADWILPDTKKEDRRRIAQMSDDELEEEILSAFVGLKLVDNLQKRD